MADPEQTEDDRRRRAELLALLALLLLGVLLAAFLIVSGRSGGSDTPSPPSTVPAPTTTTTTTPDSGGSTGEPAQSDPAATPAGSTGSGTGTVDGGAGGGSSPGSGATTVVTTTPGAGVPDPTPSPPGTPRITAGPADPTRATGGTFYFTASDATGYLCSTDVAPAFVACTNPTAYPGGTFPEGEHTFRVKAVSAGGTSIVVAYTWTVDTTPPPAPTFRRTPDNPNTGDRATFEIADAEQGVTYECSVDGDGYVACAGTVELKDLPGGEHTFCARALDAAGNRSAATCFTWQEGSSGGSGGGGGGPQPYSISGNITTPLHPGGPAVPFDLSFSSPNQGNNGSGVDGTRVSSLVVAITSITGPNITASRPCTAADFVLTQFSGAYPFHVPFGSSTLSSLGFSSSAWPSLRLKEIGLNQDGCKGATIHFSYTGTP